MPTGLNSASSPSARAKKILNTPSRSATGTAMPWKRNLFTVKAFEPPTFELQLGIDPADSGTVESAGSYEEGDEVTLGAVSAEGYEFVTWTLTDGSTESTDASFTYTIPGEDTTLVANFTESSADENGDSPEPDSKAQSINGEYESVRYALESRTVKEEENEEDEVFYIEVSYHSDESAKVTGEGYYEYGDNAVITAVSPKGYEFYCWYEGDQIASFDAEYVFTVGRDHQLVASFAPFDNGDPDSEGSGNGYRYEFDTFLHSYFLDFLTPYTDPQKHREPSADSNYGWSPVFVPPAGGQ